MFDRLFAQVEYPIYCSDVLKDFACFCKVFEFSDSAAAINGDRMEAILKY
jgi:hypothetical protein